MTAEGGLRLLQPYHPAKQEVMQYDTTGGGGGLYAHSFHTYFLFALQQFSVLLWWRRSFLLLLFISCHPCQDRLATLEWNGRDQVCERVYKEVKGYSSKCNRRHNRIIAVHCSAHLQFAQVDFLVCIGAVV